ncbi:MAG: amidohydrolase family protein, partial [Propionibacteriaceae bacterium]
MTTYWCERAWIEDTVVAGVRVEVAGDRIAAVTATAQPESGDAILPGLVLPGLANAHSHAFHRALRARTQAAGAGSFWTWRDQMYAVASRLDPESYYDLARAVYAEMVLTGICAVAEFHYLHHQPGGRPYADPNAMGHALRAAAQDAGIRLT